MEVRGLEVEQPIMGAFAAVLNALDFPVQLLVRQHPPRLGALRDSLAERRPSGLAEGVAQASASLGEFLGELEERPGVVDRRFYAIALKARADELQGLLTRAGFAVFPLKDRALRLLVESTLRGCAPPAPSSESSMVIGLSRGQLDMGERMGRSYQLTRWPRTLPLGYMQRVLALGLPMDLSIHISPIATAQAVRTLEWQRVKMESGIAISLRRGRTASPETEIALEDASRLRDEVHRGRERLFNAAFSITIYAGTADSLKERGQQLRGLFAGSMARPGRHEIPAARRPPLHASPGPEPGGLLAHGGHHHPRLPLALRAPRPGHPQGHPLRPGPAVGIGGHLRPLRRGLPQRQHGGHGQERSGEVLLHQAGSAQGHIQGHRLLRHRPRRGVRIPGPGRRGKGADTRRRRSWAQPLRSGRGG